MEAFDNWERWGDTEEERNMERTGTTPNETKNTNTKQNTHKRAPGAVGSQHNHG